MSDQDLRALERDFLATRDTKAGLALYRALGRSRAPGCPVCRHPLCHQDLSEPDLPNHWGNRVTCAACGVMYMTGAAQENVALLEQGTRVRDQPESFESLAKIKVLDHARAQGVMLEFDYSTPGAHLELLEGRDWVAGQDNETTAENIRTAIQDRTGLPVGRHRDVVTLTLRGLDVDLQSSDPEVIQVYVWGKVPLAPDLRPQGGLP